MPVTNRKAVEASAQQIRKNFRLHAQRSRHGAWQVTANCSLCLSSPVSDVSDLSSSTACCSSLRLSFVSTVQECVLLTRQCRRWSPSPSPCRHRRRSLKPPRRRLSRRNLRRLSCLSHHVSPQLLQCRSSVAIKDQQLVETNPLDSPSPTAKSLATGVGVYCRSSLCFDSRPPSRSRPLRHSSRVDGDKKANNQAAAADTEERER